MQNDLLRNIPTPTAFDPAKYSTFASLAVAIFAFRQIHMDNSDLSMQAILPKKYQKHAKYAMPFIGGHIVGMYWELTTWQYIKKTRFRLHYQTDADRMVEEYFELLKEDDSEGSGDLIQG